MLLHSLSLSSCGHESSSDVETHPSDTDSQPVDELSCQPGPNCKEAYCDQVLIPAGEFTMGSEVAPDGEVGGVFGHGDERPPHPVYLDAYCVDKYEVTYERYLACFFAGVCDPDGHTFGGTFEIEGNPIVVNHYPDECLYDPTPCIHYAVNCRSKETAAQYCEWVGMRLCTEAEWERAATGPDGENLYAWGIEEPVEGDTNVAPWSEGWLVAHVDAYKYDTTSDGARQMTGNIVEWVSDLYAPYEVGADGDPVINPDGPEDGTYSIGRGGCFFSDPVTNKRRQTLNAAFDKG